MLLTVDQLQDALPGIKNAESVINFLNIHLFKYNITNTEQVAQFLAQTGYESANWTVLEENLNYSESALLAVFPSHFSGDAEASEYARHPVRIANRVYANRMGNGDEASGDGWRFRGRGIIQITGRDNYTEFAKWCGLDTSENATTYIETNITGAILAGMWFWVSNHLQEYSDNVAEVTRIINGGYNGLSTRNSNYMRIYKLLST